MDTSEEEKAIDLKVLTRNIKETNQAIKESNAALMAMLDDLTFNSSETEDAVKEFIETLKEV